MFSELFRAAVGWTCLFLRYFNLEKMEEVKNKKYFGSYSFAGRIFILDALIILMILLICGLVAVEIVRTIMSIFN